MGSSDKSLDILSAISEKTGSVIPVKISSNLIMHNSFCDVNIAIHNQVIINTYDIFVKSKEIQPVLRDYHFGESKFYLIRGVGIRSNLEKEFVSFIELYLEQQGLE